MAISYKDGRIMTIVSEFVKIADQTSYEINGVDIEKAVFFSREPLLTYVVIPVGDYTITGTTDDQQLVITNPELLEVSEGFQVCYEEINDSSPYDPPIQSTDPEILKDAYNVLQRNFTELWEYVKNVCLATDISDLSNILPNLGVDEIWVKTIDGWRGMDVRAFEFEVEGFWAEFDERTAQALLDLDAYQLVKEAEIDVHVETVSKPEVKTYGEAQMDAYMVSDVKPDMDAHELLKEAEMDAHELIKEGELDVHTGIKIQALDDKFDELKHDNGIILENTVSLHDLEYGRWWTADITQFADCPTGLGTGDEQGTLEIVIANGRQLLKYFSVTGKIFFQIESTIGGYTPWAETGGEDVNIAKIGNLGADFKFAPIVWDNGTLAYIKATAVTGADCISINADTDEGVAFYDSRIKIPTGSLDDLGNPFEDGQDYFLSQTVDGKFQKEKPTTGAWQPMFKVMSFDSSLYAMIEIDTFEDITPIVYVGDEPKRIATMEDVGKNTEQIENSYEYGSNANGFWEKNTQTGKITQEGFVDMGTLVHGSKYIITFPIVFPNSVRSIILQIEDTITTEFTAIYVNITNRTLTNAEFQYGAVNGGSYFVKLNFIAIGD